MAQSDGEPAEPAIAGEPPAAAIGADPAIRGEAASGTPVGSAIPGALARDPRAPAPSVREPDDWLVDRELLERIWRGLTRWAVPVMMAGAYTLLAVTSETDAAGKAWMAVGFGFVLVVWFVFRALTETAALARALSVGDTVKLFELAARYLPRKRRPVDRAPFLIGRALALQLRGEFAEALATLDEARPTPELQPLARAVRIGALVELGRPLDPTTAASLAPSAAAPSPAARRGRRRLARTRASNSPTPKGLVR